MKKVLFALSICIAAATIASCSKEEIEQSVSFQDFTFEASFEVPQDVNKDDKTKVSFTQDVTTHTLTPTWEEDDIIIGTIRHSNSQDINKVTYQVTNVDPATEEGKTIAHLRITDYTGPDLEAGDVISLIYAPGITNYDNLDIETGKITVDLSKMVKGTPKDLNAIMYSTLTITPQMLEEHVIKHKFYNKTAILEIDGMSGFVVPANNTKVDKIVVSGEEVFNSAVIDLQTGNVTGKTRGEIVFTPTDPIVIDYTKDNNNGELATLGKLFAVMIPGQRTVDVCARSEVNYFRSTINSTNYVASKCYYTNRKLGPIATFSISETEKVLFAPSNLLYTHPGNWGFFPKSTQVHEQTYNRLRNTSGNVKNNTYAEGDQVDLFSWSTGQNKGGLNAMDPGSDVGTDFYDWGNLVTGWDPTYWKTLSRDQWNYLLGHNYNKIITDGSTNNEKVLVIFPNQTLTDTWNTTTKIVDAVNAQCLVLPAAGIRNKVDNTSAKVNQNTTQMPGLYHTSTYYGVVDGIHYCDWQINSTKTASPYNHQGSVADGISVRLAHIL